MKREIWIHGESLRIEEALVSFMAYGTIRPYFMCFSKGRDRKNTLMLIRAFNEDTGIPYNYDKEEIMIYSSFGEEL
jgi:hypothetical protein